jgi:hypothetical protein
MVGEKEIVRNPSLALVETNDHGKKRSKEEKFALLM